PALSVFIPGAMGRFVCQPFMIGTQRDAAEMQAHRLPRIRQWISFYRILSIVTKQKAQAVTTRCIQLSDTVCYRIDQNTGGPRVTQRPARAFQTAPVPGQQRYLASGLDAYGFYQLGG